MGMQTGIMRAQVCKTFVAPPPADLPGKAGLEGVVVAAPAPAMAARRGPARPAEDWAARRAPQHRERPALAEAAAEGEHQGAMH